MRLIRIFGAIFAISLKRELALRTNFVVSGVQAIVVTAAGLVTIGAVYRQTASLGGWSLGEALVLLGTFQVMSGLLATFIEPNVRWFGQVIQTGQLDEKLLKPVPSLFLVSLGSHAPFGLVQVVPGAGLVVAGLRDTGDIPGPLQVAGGLAMLAIGIAIMWATRVGLAVVVLWAPSLALDVVHDAVWQFGRYPVSIYRQPLRLVLSSVIPLAFISTAPAHALTRGIDGSTLLIGAGIAAIAIVAVRQGWRRGLSRYTSATS